MAAAKVPAKVAETFNLTDAEAKCVAAYVEQFGMSVEKAVVAVRGERIGTAADPEFRPLSDEAKAELGVSIPEPAEAGDGDVILMDDVEPAPVPEPEVKP